jgi:murein DD-endopeptidase MepM/ murein hydrolase activator NlpD
MLCKNFKKILLAAILAALVAPNCYADTKSDILNLSDAISEKKDQLKKVEDELEEYKNKIEETRKQSVTLKNQIELLTNYIKRTELEIKGINLKIGTLNSEISSINTEIADTQTRIGLQKELIAYYLKEIRRLDVKTPLEIILLHPSFSSFFDELRYLKTLQDNLNRSLIALKDLNTALDNKQSDLKNKKETNVKLKKNLEDKKSKLEAQKTAKTFLIGQTFASESKFQALLLEAKEEYEDLDSEIARMEKQVREKLKQSDLLPYGGNVVLTWPVPKDDITAYFHDDDYPYKYIFEHSGIDIRAPQGTPIAAPAPGYVLQVGNFDSWRKTNYVVLVHAGGISTVYLHLSRVYAKPDTYVSRGDVIGATGGYPRTRGAGLFTTGPHLHFEVRQNSVPVNPFNYLVDM